ncbi:MAG TPA: NADH-ubiquinone oxidoreductase-F iron-sulfur binding region domain-containing protein [Burkholderiales bacterium]|nr:NADH-ubiquinone oxidoreductase-F iron-sulfur binding region domain-containing protein [Burkholderiales bacterium]
MDPTEAVERAVARYGAEAPRLLAMLHSVQASLGCVPAEALDRLAAAVRLTRAEVESTASFYHLLHSAPHGKYEVLFSDNVIDHMAGKAELMRYFCDELLIQPGKQSEDGLVFVDSTSDIGLADQAPGALVNGLLVPSLDRNRLDLIANLIREQRPFAQWPQTLFEVPDNVRKSGPLLGEPFRPGAGLRRALELGPDAILAELDAAYLRGRGGAGYKTAAKWGSCRKAQGRAHYVVCNADEGEPGTFKDRVLLASHADLVFEGMTIAARVLGAQSGTLYLRGEYRCLADRLRAARTRRRATGLLGRNILSTPGFDFDVEIVLGAGAYICGEESALIESLEGKPGRPRNRPPYPDTQGYLGQPTVVNNVETYACAAKILERGGAWFAGLGTSGSTGTKLLSVSGDCKRPGVYEVPFGVTLRQVLAECGAQQPQAVQVGGPSGTCVPWREFERRVSFEDVPSAGAFMVFSRSRDMFEVARNFTHFFAHESCGFCTPCRVGTSLLRDTMDKLSRGKGSAYDMERMQMLMRVMRSMSHCGLGHTAANPVVQTMQAFPEAYERRLRNLGYEPSFDLDAALETARLITRRDDEWAHIVSEEP